jgi:hypothetical protein
MREISREDTMVKHWVFAAAALFAMAGCTTGSEKGDIAEPDFGTASQADSATAPYSAAPIAFGEIKTATFTTRAEFRAFSFDGEKGQKIDAYLDGRNGLDTVLYVYRATASGKPYGRALRKNDDTPRPGWSIRGGAANELSSSINDYVLPATGTADVTVKSPDAYQTVTVAQLEANPQDFDGKKVRVVASPKVETVACTKMACPESNPCCNRCGGAFKIGQDIVLNGATEAWGCGGNECTWRSSCTGFASNDPGLYEIKGTVALAGDYAFEIKVDRLKAQTCQKGGCSRQHCVNNPSNAVTTCEWREEYACYQSATCEAQANGHCAWTSTPQLESCLSRR